MPTRRALLTLVAAAAAAAGCSTAASAAGQLVEMQVVDRARGDVLPTWRARGADWVAGRPGDRYAVRLSNRTGGRVLVVLSVDGVNAVSGETAATAQTGYVLGPWASTEITGWRKSWQEAAAFYFTSLPDSYAARTDRPDHVGVIGAAVFRERVETPVWRRDPPPPIARGRVDNGRADERFRQEPESRAQASGAGDAAREGAADRSMPSAAPAPAPSLQAPRESMAKAEKLGTGHGEREWAPTTQTRFERATREPAEVVQLRYDSRDNLLAAGIIGRPRPHGVPDPFPSFAPDPR